MAQEEVHATLEVDAAPGGKNFQGVWLRVDNEEPLLVDYRQNFWKAFDGLRVRARGYRWEPDSEEQHVDELDVVESDSSPEFVGLRDVVSLKGRFEEITGEKGSKSEGESKLVFIHAQEGNMYGLANRSSVHRSIGMEDVTLRGRVMLRSPFWAHSDIHTMWVLSVEAGDGAPMKQAS